MLVESNVITTHNELTEAIVHHSSLRNDPMINDSEMNQVPSQVSEGDLGTLPINRPLFTLLVGTSLDPWKGCTILSRW